MPEKHPLLRPPQPPAAGATPPEPRHTTPAAASPPQNPPTPAVNAPVPSQNATRRNEGSGLASPVTAQSGRSDRVSATAAYAGSEALSRQFEGSNVPLLDPQRMTPKSPRAALEPERVAMPTRRSKRAKHPIVIMGNAIFTLILLLALGIGGVVLWGKQRFEAPGPLTEDKIVNIPRGGVRDIAEMLVREGVITDPWVFIGGALALKARGEDLQIRRVPVSEAREPARRRRDHDRGQGGPASIHARRRAHLRTDRRAAAGERRAFRKHPRDPARRNAAAGILQVHARHDARADDPAHAAGAGAACCRKSGTAACRICRSRRRNSL